MRRAVALPVLLMVVPLLAVGCGGEDPEMPLFLTCQDRAEGISVDTTVSGGGDHLLRVGAHTLAVPASAIPMGESVRFELHQVSSFQVRMIVEVEADQAFADDLTLTLSYGERTGCRIADLPVGGAANLVLLRVETGEILVPATAPEQGVAGKTRSFSTFAIAG